MSTLSDETFQTVHLDVFLNGGHLFRHTERLRNIDGSFKGTKGTLVLGRCCAGETCQKRHCSRCDHQQANLQEHVSAN
jgi:hypothetical protein